MGAPYAGGPPTEGHGYWDDSQQTSGPGQYLPFQSRDPRAMTNLPGAYPGSNPDLRQFQEASPRGSFDRDGPQQQSYQSNQVTGRYTPQDNDSSSALKAGADLSKQAGSHRPSGPRLCAKCNQPLSGQFVRALENTYHLECFTCHVSPDAPTSHPMIQANLPSRNAERSWRQSSSPSLTKVQINTRSAKLTISGGWVSSAILVAVLFVAPTSRPWTGNTTSSISPAPSAPRNSERKTAIMSTKATCTAITITRPNSPNVAKAAKMPFSSSLSKSSETARISTGIQSAT